MRGVVGSMLGMLEGGATHLGVATDHVIESFRNALWPGYKTGEGIDPAAVRPVPAAGGGADRAGGGRLAHGRVRGRRCAGRRGGHGGGRCARRPGRRLLAGQGSGAMRARGPDRAARSAHARAAERGGGAAEIRCPSRLDSRLARARGRQRRRVPRPAQLGRDVRGGGARPLSSPRPHPAAGEGLGGVGARRAAAGHDACGAARARRCSSGSSPGCGRMRPSASTWTRCAGAGRAPTSRPGRSGSARPQLRRARALARARAAP